MLRNTLARPSDYRQRCSMSEIWKRWEGQIIGQKYQLRQYVGSTDHSAVFSAEYRDPEPRKAAVKFLSADIPQAEKVLADWKNAQELNHPNLLKIYSVGRCKIEDMELLYAAMEYAEENLAEILPHRALTTDEAREIVGTVSNVLVYLHGNNLTHGHIKPSNILAIGDQIKLASDTVQALNGQRDLGRERDAYDAPELPSSSYAPPADVWSLGVTLVEALTQQPAFLPFNENAEPVIPTNVREPFREIARHALRRNANSRWSSAEIADHLNPAPARSAQAARAAAAASAASSASASSVAVATRTLMPTPRASSSTKTEPTSPLSVPLSQEPAVPLGQRLASPPPVSRAPIPPPPLPRMETGSARKQTIVLPNYVVPLFAAVLVVVAAMVLPKILHRGTQTAAVVTPPPAVSAPAPTADTSASTNSPDATEPAPTQPAKSEAAPVSHSDDRPPQRASSSAPASATLHSSDSGASAMPQAAKASPGRGEVLDQILPRPSSGALATVQGTVRVLVRVHVDPAGNVSQATLENGGPSRYFADKSLEAARGWVFSPPDSDGHSQPSQWLIRFEYTSSGIKAYPNQVSP
jgi:eukaryotic-like serine/threonine-protein kinase